MTPPKLFGIAIPNRTKWCLDECPDANGNITIREADGSPNGDTSKQPIATVYRMKDAILIVRQHNQA